MPCSNKPIKFSPIPWWVKALITFIHSLSISFLPGVGYPWPVARRCLAPWWAVGLQGWSWAAQSSSAWTTAPTHALITGPSASRSRTMRGPGRWDSVISPVQILHRTTELPQNEFVKSYWKTLLTVKLNEVVPLYCQFFCTDGTNHKITCSLSCSSRVARQHVSPNINSLSKLLILLSAPWPFLTAASNYKVPSSCSSHEILKYPELPDSNRIELEQPLVCAHTLVRAHTWTHKQTNAVWGRIPIWTIQRDWKGCWWALEC